MYGRLIAALLAAVVLIPGSAWSAESLKAPAGVEDELIGKARSGRLSTAELVRRGDDLSLLERLELYYYAMELEPYFLGIEDMIRDIARGDPRKRPEIEKLVAGLLALMTKSRERLLASDRPDPEADWRRGLAGLIFLDFDWRRRVAEQGKDEIKNPYDLVGLLDCLDARLRGLEDCNIQQCMGLAIAPGPRSKP